MFGMSFETQGSQTFWRDIPGFCWDIREKFEKKMFVFNSRPLSRDSEIHRFQRSFQCSVIIHVASVSFSASPAPLLQCPCARAQHPSASLQTILTPLAFLLLQEDWMHENSDQ